MAGAKKFKEWWTLADNAKEWAEAFNDCAIRSGYQEMDEKWLAKWFLSFGEYAQSKQFLRQVGEAVDRRHR